MQHEIEHFILHVNYLNNQLISGRFVNLILHEDDLKQSRIIFNYSEVLTSKQKAFLLIINVVEFKLEVNLYKEFFIELQNQFFNGNILYTKELVQIVTS